MKKIELKINKANYYSSTISLLRLLSILTLLCLGGTLIFRSTLQNFIEEYYIKGSTLSLWISVIGSGLNYYFLWSNYKKSIQTYGPEEHNEPESIKSKRLFGSSKIEYISIAISTVMIALGLWFGAVFLVFGLLNP
ncbi:MAG: hypothetical protein AAF462_02415 [Thermodesulfobacteriota bacterium]